MKKLFSGALVAGAIAIAATAASFRAFYYDQTAINGSTNNVAQAATNAYGEWIDCRFIDAVGVEFSFRLASTTTNAAANATLVMLPCAGKTNARFGSPIRVPLTSNSNNPVVTNVSIACTAFGWLLITNVENLTLDAALTNVSVAKTVRQ